jgi:hypothetical protein
MGSTCGDGLAKIDFSEPAELVGILTRVVGEMQRYPELIRPYLQPFC